MPVTLSTRQASVAVLCAAVIWGLYWLPLRVLEDMGIAGPQATLMLNAPAALAAGVWAAVSWRALRGHFANALLVGFFGGAGLALFSLAVFETTVIRATLLFYLMPVWGTALGIVWLGERANWTRWAAIGAGLGGLFLLILGAPEGSGARFNLGDVMALAAGWGWAIAMTLVKKRSDIPVAGMLTAQFLFVVVVALGLGSLLGTQEWPSSNLTLAALPLSLSVALLGVIPATAAILWASKFLFPGRIGLLLMAEVAVAVLSASLLLPDETLSAMQWGAVALILGAGFLEISPEKSV